MSSGSHLVEVGSGVGLFAMNLAAKGSCDHHKRSSLH